MKKVKILAIALLAGICMTGCTSVNKETKTEAAQQNEATEQTETTEQAEATEQAEGTAFELTSEEQKLYKEYSANKDISIFKDVSQVTIAKIFIQCGIEGNWEGEFNLIAPKDFTVTKEQYKEVNDKDVAKADIKSRKEMADAVFALLNDGVVTETSDNECYIAYFDPYNEENVQFYLYKNEDGIWLIDYKTFV